MESTTDPRGNLPSADAAAYTVNYRYDDAGRLAERKAPTVQIEKNGTAQPGRPTTRFGYDTVGHQTHEVDAEGRLTTSGFDRADRLTSITGMPYTPPGGTALTPSITHAYDAAGRLTRTTDPRGNATSFEYDALDNRVRVTDPPAAPGQPAGQWVNEFDKAGEQLTAIDPTGARTQATYDDLGRQITRTIVERKPVVASYITNLEYDDAGNPTKAILPGNKITSYTVNAVGEVTAKTDPMNNITRYDYDLIGRPAKVTDAEENASTAEYDRAGRLTGVKNLDKTGAIKRAVGYGYDAAGNPTEITSGEGHVTRRTFDASNLLTQLVEPVSATGSITTTFGYDATGARTRLADGRGNATWTGYNTLGLIETLTEPVTTAHPALADRTWTHVYDAAGNETALIKPGGVRLDQQYDQLNRLTRSSGSGAGIVASDKTYGYDLADRPTTVGDQSLEYNDRGLLTKLTPPSGSNSTFAYDALGNPTQRVDVTGTTTYTWDNASRLRTVSDPVSGRTNTYDYDKADRLTTITSTNPVNTQAYTYDALDRPLTQTLKNSTGGELAKITYGWDGDDNLTSKTTSGLPGAGANTYGYDHSGRLTSWTAPDGTTTAYEWDAAGNRTRAGSKTYTYDERNRMTSGDGGDYTYTPRGTLASATKSGTTRHLTFDAFDRLVNDGDTAYTYDAFDRMSSRQSASGQQRFAYAGTSNDIITITDQNGAVQSRYGRDPFGDLTSVKDGTGPALGAFTDLHSDLVATFSGTAVATATAYSPFGEITAQTGTRTSLGYQSEYTDPDTGTVNMYARWYQPGTGTFTSRDDWTLPATPSVQANRYTYGNASPLIHRDPNGHDPCRSDVFSLNFS
ncbi:RHS repeat-associated core domain-containing protein [Nonomuraea rhizosphaerae]|uniref:RHS repeat-associated core domain-containing protein n=1 Tax=Nonomuraea rhizosphaerae TaxID=2665663 RepID=UPI001C5D36EB|nr:RHS repeat-associated core domain-containing protein [Nonomuraea rhizosphaerae]